MLFHENCGNAFVYMDMYSLSSKEYCVLEFEFTKAEEVLEAISNSIYGDNTMSNFTIKQVAYYLREDFE